MGADQGAGRDAVNYDASRVMLESLANDRSFDDLLSDGLSMLLEGSLLESVPVSTREYAEEVQLLLTSANQEYRVAGHKALTRACDDPRLRSLIIDAIDEALGDRRLVARIPGPTVTRAGELSTLLAKTGLPQRDGLGSKPSLACAKGPTRPQPPEPIEDLLAADRSRRGHGR